MAQLGNLLLDTNVISELARPRPEAKVVRFLSEAIEPWLSTITLHELVYGAERMPDQFQRVRLLTWIAEIGIEFSGRFVIADNDVAERRAACALLPPRKVGLRIRSMR